MAAQGMKFVLNLAGTVVLARLLTPDDYGLFGMVMVVVGFAEMFKDAGLSMATVQKDQISHEQISTLFWLNLMISTFLGICVMLASPLVARFYGRPELTTVTSALAISFIIGGLIVQHQALLIRHMYFDRIASIQILSQIVSLGVTIVLALLGWGYWALIGGTITSSLVNIPLTLFFCPWVPGCMKKGTGVRKMLKFGGHLTGFNIMNYFARNMDNILVGKLLGADALGFYAKAYQILMLPINMLSGPLGVVAVPTLSRLATDPQKLHRYYLHILYMLSLVGAPVATVSYVASKDIIHILLGPSWYPVVDVFKLLAIGGLVQPLYFTQSWLHVAMGRAERVFIWGLIGSSIIVGSFVIGLQWGVKGVALCYSIAIYITTIASLKYAGNSAGLSLRKMVAVVIRPLTACVFSAFITLKILFFWGGALSSWNSLALSLILFIVLYTAFLTLFYRGFKPLFDLMAIVDLLKKKPEKEQPNLL